MFDYFLEEAKFGHALVIPHDSVENSFAELVKTKKPNHKYKVLIPHTAIRRV
jgi:hypothetical protein